MSFLELEKADARTAGRAVRALCKPMLGGKLAYYVPRDFPPPAGAVVAGFWPLPGEINILPLLETLASQRYEICLPVTPRRGYPLSFRQWRPGDEMIAGRYGTFHTNGAEMAPDFMLVPLLAFDSLGNRLGYGGGYYDRTFESLPDAIRLGCGYAALEVNRVPTGPYDMTLHAIATELGVRKF